jgi:predicted transcriptional regulator
MSKQETSNVVQLPTPKKVDRTSEKKWGKAVMAQGFSIIPSLLLKAQRRLHLKPTELAILMHLADFWWDPERKPFPSKERLSDRLGINPRQIQWWIANLEKAGLVKRTQRYATHGGKLTNEYDLSGLVARLKEIEPDFREVEEQVRSKRRAVGQPGLRKRSKPTNDE